MVDNGCPACAGRDTRGYGSSASAVHHLFSDPPQPGHTLGQGVAMLAWLRRPAYSSGRGRGSMRRFGRAKAPRTAGSRRDNKHGPRGGCRLRFSCASIAMAALIALVLGAPVARAMDAVNVRLDVPAIDLTDAVEHRR